MSKRSITSNKRTKRQELREAERRQQLQQAQRARTRRIAIGGAALVLLAAVALFYFMTSGRTSSDAQATPANANPSNTTSSNPGFAPVDGISCDGGEHYDYHHHIHLNIYIDGRPIAVPQNIGVNPAVANPCLYWLHTHDTNGVVHIESPVRRDYPLGAFFNVWSQRFAQLGYPAQLNQVSGWQVYVNGQPYKGDFRAIPMQEHTLITMAYNSPGIKPETIYNWNGL